MSTGLSQPDRPLKIALMGAPIGIGNRGVSALGVSVIRLFCSANNTAKICLLMGDRSAAPKRLVVDGVSRLVPVINYRLSPKAPLQQQLWWIVVLALAYRVCGWRWLRKRIEAVNPWIRAATASDVVADIRGGDSFSDIYGLKRFLTGALTVMSVVWVRGKIVLLPQTYGPYKSLIARCMARYILLRAVPVLSRDRAGLEVVTEITKGLRHAVFCPDVAFALESRLPASVELAPPLPSSPDAPGVVVGINVNGLMFNGGYTRQNMFGLRLNYQEYLRRLLLALLAEPTTEILLVPHTFAPAGSVESDNEACQVLARAVPSEHANRVHVVSAEYDQHEIKGVIGTCEFFVGSRMHACIAALSQGIPAVGVAYSKKFSGVFASVGADAWVVDGRESDVQQALAATLDVFHRRKELRISLADRVNEAQQLLAKTFNRLARPESG